MVNWCSMYFMAWSCQRGAGRHTWQAYRSERAHGIVFALQCHFDGSHVTVWCEVLDVLVARVF